jgi:hypothetical protein
MERKRTKLGTALVAAAAGPARVAGATTFNEGADFSDIPASPTLLPVGTDVVNGDVDGEGGDPLDAITFQGLTPGQGWTLQISGNPDVSLDLDLLDDAGASLDMTTVAPGGTASLMGTVPAAGELNFSVEEEASGFSTYRLDLTVPEPSAALLLGGGALLAAVLRRTRRAGGEA